MSPSRSAPGIPRMRVRIDLSLLALAFLALSPAHVLHGFQKGGMTTDLTSLPYEGRRLEVGRVFAGELTTADWMYSDSSYVQAWAIDGVRDASVSIDLVSHDFDSYLFIRGPGDLSISDDDGAGECHSRATFVFPQTGTYLVIVNTAQSRSTGRFTLHVRQAVTRMHQGRCSGIGRSVAIPPSRMLRAPASVSGTLTSLDPVHTDTTHYQVWGVRGSQGDVLTIDLNSDDFDPYLFVYGRGIIESDDDGGAGCNSRAVVTLPEDGYYRIIANTVGQRETGDFSIVIRTGRLGPEEDPCRQ